MKSFALSRTDLLVLPEIALVLFLMVFVGALIWIFRPGSKNTYDRRSLLPLTDDTPIEPLEVRHGQGH